MLLSVKKEPVRSKVTRPAMQCFSSNTIVGLYSFKKNSAFVLTTPIFEATSLASSTLVTEIFKNINLMELLVSSPIFLYFRLNYNLM